MAQLNQLLSDFQEHMNDAQLAINGVDYASADAEDPNVMLNSFFEGLYLRAYTTFERSLEAAFLHYATGGVSLSNWSPTCRLANCSEDQVRAILKGSQRYIDWSNPQAVRERCDLFFESGEPLRTGIDSCSEILTDMQKLRNMIAHDSPEAASGYRDVQIHNFTTVRVFLMSPGQLLRARRKRRPYMSWCAYYFTILCDVFEAIANKA